MTTTATRTTTTRTTTTRNTTTSRTATPTTTGIPLDLPHGAWAPPGTRVLWCGPCGGDRPFEQPGCVDEHDDCPEWACTDCGAAVVLAVLAARDVDVLAGALVPLQGSRVASPHAA